MSNVTKDHAVCAVTPLMFQQGHLSRWQRWRVSYRQLFKCRGWTDVVRYVSDQDARKFCKNHRLPSPIPGGQLEMSNIAARSA